MIRSLNYEKFAQSFGERIKGNRPFKSAWLTNEDNIQMDLRRIGWKFEYLCRNVTVTCGNFEKGNKSSAFKWQALRCWPLELSDCYLLKTNFFGRGIIWRERLCYDKRNKRCTLHIKLFREKLERWVFFYHFLLHLSRWFLLWITPWPKISFTLRCLWNKAHCHQHALRS